MKSRSWIFYPRVKPETVEKLRSDVAALQKEGTARQQALGSLEQRINEIEQQARAGQ